MEEQMNRKIMYVSSVVAVMAASVLLSGVYAGEKVNALKPVKSNDTAEKGAKREAAKQKAEAAKEARGEAKQARETKREELQNRAQEGRENAVDRRENNQEKRIQHGINKGYLTDEEVKKLEAQQSSIETLENSFTSDGKLTGNEFKQLQEALNTASHCIWGEKHDTDGNQMAAYRFGKNVFAKDSLTAKMTDENLSGAEAKAIMKDFRKMMDLKKSLSGDLSDAERAKLQAQYDELLNQYFETR